jgi:DnaJ-class molecular chaperone
MQKTTPGIAIGERTGKAYHLEMKRDLPVTCCTECGGVGYNMRVANGRCSKTIGEQRCSGTNAIAAKPSDWIECTHCQATGYYRNKECPSCKGAGYLFVGLRDKAAV